MAPVAGEGMAEEAPAQDSRSCSNKSRQRVTEVEDVHELPPSNKKAKVSAKKKVKRSVKR